MSLCIYLLRLRNGKFYVGSSTDVDRRFQQHLDGVGSEWTRLHAPACRAPQILETNASLLDEDKFTKKLMIEHGVDNVRGGSYCQVELTDVQLAALEAELRSATAACLCCGHAGHFARNCPARQRQRQQRKPLSPPAKTTVERVADLVFAAIDVVTSRTSAPAPAPAPKRKQSRPRGGCERCGRESHDVDACYAVTDANGNPIEDEEEEEEEENECFRCGRVGHFAAACYARTSVDGKYIGTKSRR
jgi:hypothetical protein